jgi:predicted phosphodiesterase
MRMKRLLILSDVHLPFQHPQAFEFLQKVKKDVRPDHVISVGDIIDLASVQVSRPSDPNIDSPIFELEKARKEIKILEKIFPKMQICWGNHDLRLLRKAELVGIPRSMLRDINSILEVKAKWTWHDKIIITLPNGQQVYFTHNFKRNAMSSSKELGVSFCQGHFHTALSCEFWSSPTALNFALNVGCLINPKAEAFRYQKNFLKRPILGCAAIIDSSPRLYSMLLNSNGKWLGKL